MSEDRIRKSLETWRKIAEFDLLNSDLRAIFGKDGCALQHVFEFADIARPVVRGEHLHGFGVEAFGGTALGLTRQKMIYKDRQIFLMGLE